MVLAKIPATVGAPWLKQWKCICRSEGQVRRWHVLLAGCGLAEDMSRGHEWVLAWARASAANGAEAPSEQKTLMNRNAQKMGSLG